MKLADMDINEAGNRALFAFFGGLILAIIGGLILGNALDNRGPGMGVAFGWFLTGLGGLLMQAGVLVFVFVGNPKR
jgi:hypothetical protein